MRLAEVGRIANLPEVLVKYREHLAKAGHTHAARQTPIPVSVYDTHTWQRDKTKTIRQSAPRGGSGP